MPQQMTALSATGALGHEPIHPESFYEGIKRPLDFIGADAGSGDSGPFFLGSNEPMNPREWEFFDLELLLVAARERKIPLIIGSAGGAGTNRGVSDYVEIVREISAKHRLEPFRLATIRSEVPLPSATNGRTVRSSLSRKRRPSASSCTRSSGNIGGRRGWG